MKRAVVTAVMLMAGATAQAAETSYPVSGSVVEISDKVIVVKKGRETWAINRNAGTQVKGDIKKGGKVTVRYTMTATSIEARGDTKKNDDKKK